jgi:hypothetical protein
MEKLVIEIDEQLYRKLLLMSLKNHTTISEVISYNLTNTLFKEEKKQQRPIQTTKNIIKIYNLYKSVLSNWDNNFILSLIENQFELSDKQIIQLQKITLKHPSLYEQLGI